MKKPLSQKAYIGALEKKIFNLSDEEIKTLFHNIKLGRFATLEDVINSVIRLIESHIVIFDGKESLFFKATGKQIWLKHD